MSTNSTNRENYYKPSPGQCNQIFLLEKFDKQVGNLLYRIRGHQNIIYKYKKKLKIFYKFLVHGLRKYDYIYQKVKKNAKENDKKNMNNCVYSAILLEYIQLCLYKRYQTLKKIGQQ